MVIYIYIKYVYINRWDGWGFKTRPDLNLLLQAHGFRHSWISTQLMGWAFKTKLNLNLLLQVPGFKLS
jgi:hypothetical protein